MWCGDTLRQLWSGRDWPCISYHSFQSPEFSGGMRAKLHVSVCARASRGHRRSESALISRSALIIDPADREWLPCICGAHPNEERLGRQWNVLRRLDSCLYILNEVRHMFRRNRYDYSYSETMVTMQYPWQESRQLAVPETRQLPMRQRPSSLQPTPKCRHHV